MTEHADLLLGVTIADGTTNRTYSSHRIDYDDDRDLAEIAGVDDPQALQDQYTSQVKSVSQTAIDRGHHTPKNGYQRLVLVEDATTRDEVQADLDAEGVAYTTEDVSPSKQEKIIIEREEAGNISEVEQALTETNDILERKLVSGQSKEKMASSIQNISDADAKVTAEVMYEVLTGETPSETLA